ncbi:MAG TPA: hypothetical protein GXX20_06815 [Clostridiaceae bacterium]|nr:hypothetical protein [Clostridiaceae bacterium]
MVHKKFVLSDFICSLDKSLCDYSLQEAEGKKTILTIASNPEINQGVSIVRIHVPGVSYGEHVVLNAMVKNIQESFGTGFCNVVFFKQGKPMVNKREGGVPYDSGACQFYGHGLKDYQYHFTVPYGVDSMEIYIACKNNGILHIENLEACICDSLPLLHSHSQSPKCVAHLGMIGYAPRNTMPAFYLAKRAGYRECVTNTNYTADGHIVALHNDEIDETSNGTGCIHDMTLAQVRQYDFGGYVDEVYQGTEIPLLEEVLKFMSKSGLRPVLRLTHHFTGEKVHYLHQIHRMVKSLGLDGRCTAKAFDKRVLEELSKIAGDDFRYGYCCKGYSKEDIPWIKKLGRDVYFDIRYKDITEEGVHTAIDNGIAVETWIINDFESIVKLMEMGVTGFTTDFYCLDGCMY